MFAYNSRIVIKFEELLSGWSKCPPTHFLNSITQRHSPLTGHVSAHLPWHQLTRLWVEIFPLLDKLKTAFLFTLYHLTVSWGTNSLRKLHTTCLSKDLDKFVIFVCICILFLPVQASLGSPQFYKQLDEEWCTPHLLAVRRERRGKCRSEKALY